jgi:hypothetical protein
MRIMLKHAPGLRRSLVGWSRCVPSDMLKSVSSRTAPELQLETETVKDGIGGRNEDRNRCLRDRRLFSECCECETAFVEEQDLYTLPAFAVPSRDGSWSTLICRWPHKQSVSKKSLRPRLCCYKGP